MSRKFGAGLGVMLEIDSGLPELYYGDEIKIRCNFCGADAGNKCKDMSSGRIYSDPHTTRRQDWKKLQDEKAKNKYEEQKNKTEKNAPAQKLIEALRKWYYYQETADLNQGISSTKLMELLKELGVVK